MKATLFRQRGDTSQIKVEEVSDYFKGRNLL